MQLGRSTLRPANYVVFLAFTLRSLRQHMAMTSKMNSHQFFQKQIVTANISVKAFASLTGIAQKRAAPYLRR
jgi:hypothetical protein